MQDTNQCLNIKIFFDNNFNNKKLEVSYRYLFFELLVTSNNALVHLLYRAGCLKFVSITLK